MGSYNTCHVLTLWWRRTSGCASALKPALLLRSLRDTSENWWNGKPKNQMVLSWRNVSILKYLPFTDIKHNLFCPACLKKAAFFSKKKLCSPLSCPASARLSGHEVGQCCWCLNQGVSIFLRNHLVQVSKKSHHKTHRGFTHQLWWLKRNFPNWRRRFWGQKVTN